jgi:hypothetical protein
MRSHREFTKEGYAMSLIVEGAMDNMQGGTWIVEEDIDENCGNCSQCASANSQPENYYSAADGILDWQVHNEIIGLREAWEYAVSKGIPREIEELRQHINVAWKVDHGAQYGSILSDGIPINQLQGSPVAQPETENIPKTEPLSEESNPRSSDSGDPLTDDCAKKLRLIKLQKVAFTKQWQILSSRIDTSQHIALAYLIDSAFNRATGMNCGDDHMPWKAGAVFGPSPFSSDRWTESKANTPNP